ncbi:hypothetical protein [Stenotrophomonas sp. SG1]|uniref:hypothetical protein n=1 Tax=Stenotrophomonas sp. SG1 TaxID=2944932 RepID=UPI0016588F66|nr:hypothetical protein [Stenotrophomonas sp. SG1]MBC9080823.1 hypothetical protein [Stenotrophomonas maltophilia]MCW8340541.1 hypothetical protein [Stenotrophomonas sp. SG1]
MSDESKHERAARIAELKRLKQSGELKFKTEVEPVVLDGEVEKTVQAIHAVTDVAKQSAVKVGAQLMGAVGKGKKALVEKLQVGQQGSVHTKNNVEAEIERTASAEEDFHDVSDVVSISTRDPSPLHEIGNDKGPASIKRKTRRVTIVLAILAAIGIGCGVYLKVFGTKGVSGASPTALPAVAPVDPFAVASESLGGSTEPIVDQDVPRVTNIEPTQDLVDANSQSNADSNDSPKKVVQESKLIRPANPQATESTAALRTRQQKKPKASSQKSPADDWQKRASDDLDKWAEQF